MWQIDPATGKVAGSKTSSSSSSGMPRNLNVCLHRSTTGHHSIPAGPPKHGTVAHYRVGSTARSGTTRKRGHHDLGFPAQTVDRLGQRCAIEAQIVVRDLCVVRKMGEGKVAFCLPLVLRDGDEVVLNELQDLLFRDQGALLTYWKWSSIQNPFP